MACGECGGLGEGVVKGEPGSHSADPENSRGLFARPHQSQAAICSGQYLPVAHDHRQRAAVEEGDGRQVDDEITVISPGSGQVLIELPAGPDVQVALGVMRTLCCWWGPGSCRNCVTGFLR